MVLITVIISQQADQEEDMDLMIRSCQNGAGASTRARLAAQVLVMTVQLICFLLIQAGLSGLLYGFPDLQAPLQSLTAYYHSPQHWTILVWLISLAADLWASGVLVITLMSLLARILGARGIWVFIILFTTGLLCFKTIPAQSIFYPLAWFNLYTLLMPVLYLRERIVLSGYEAEFWMMVLQLAIIGISLAGVLLLQPKPVHRKSQTAHGTSLYRSVSVSRHVSLQNILHHPGFLIAFLLLGLFAANCFSSIHHANSEARERIQTVFCETGGAMTDEKRAVLEEKNQAWQTMTENLLGAGSRYEKGELSQEDYEKAIAEYQNLQADQQRYSVVVQQMEQTMDPDWVIYPRGFQVLTGLNSSQSDQISALLLVLVLFAGLSGLFAADHEEDNDFLYRITKKGNSSRIRSKVMYAFVFAGAVFLIIELPGFLKIQQVLVMDNWDAPLRAIESSELLTGFPAWMENWSIRKYTILLYLIRFAGVLLVMMEIMTLSAWSSSRLKAITGSLIILLIPWLLSLAGIRWASVLSFFNLLEGNSFLRNPWDWWKIPLWIVVMALLLYGARRRKSLN